MLRSPPRLSYLFRKLGTFPWISCAAYGLRYLYDTAPSLLGISQQLSTWGPRYPGIDQDAAHYDLTEVCCRQWLACVNSFERSRNIFDPTQLLEVRYEDLLDRPAREATRICSFLSVADAKRVIGYAVREVRPENIAKYQRLSVTERRRIERVIADVLSRWDYRVA